MNIPFFWSNPEKPWRAGMWRHDMQQMVQTKEHFMYADRALAFAQKIRADGRTALIGHEGHGYTVTVVEPVFVGPLKRTQKIVNCVLVGGSIFYAYGVCRDQK
jgi:hypothetical protein